MNIIPAAATSNELCFTMPPGTKTRSTFLLQAPIHGLDEHLRGPRARVGAETSFVTERRPRRDDLLQAHALVDERLYLVADDRQHVAVVAHVGGVREPAVRGDHHRAAFRSELRDREVEHL